jgi:hypothetical protein
MVERQHYTFNNTHLNLASRLLNSLIKIQQRLKLDSVKLDRNEILENAKRKTGFENLGNDNYMEVLDRLIDNTRDVNITPLGKWFIKFMIKKIAMNRLYIENYIAKHPKVEDVNIKSPIFIVGFPRTGTTLLQNVLSVGPEYRALKLWELATPYPLHENREKDRKMRISKIAIPLRLFKVGIPNLTSFHDVRIDTNEECWVLKSNTFAILHNDIITGLHKWNNWLLKMDRSWVYEEYKRLLQLQAHNTPTGRFVLKCPTHLSNLKTIFKVFPDAHVVWTHRNPVNSITSASSGASLMRRFFLNQTYHKQLGEIVEKRFFIMIKESMKSRNQLSEDQLFDINFETLVKDIPQTVRNIRHHFKIPHSAYHDDAIFEFLNKPRKDKPGKHIYSPEQFNLDPKEIVERFSDYMDRFDIKRDTN